MWARPFIPLTGNLHISSNDPDRPEQDIPLSVTPRGALLRVPSFPVELGDVPTAKTSPPLDVTVVNDGDMPAEILPAVPSSPRFALVATPPTLAPGASGVVRVQFAPDQVGDVNGTLALATRGPLCGVPELKLHGKGTNGKALVSPGALDFGLVDCGTTADAKVVTVENVGDAAFDVDASLAIGTAFTVSPTHATIAPKDKVLLTVTPSPVPAVSAVTPDLYGDTLTLTTTAQGDVPHVIPLHETAHGAILSVSLPQTPIRARVDDVVTKPVTVTNSGNATAVGPMTSAKGSLAIPTLTVGPGATVNATLEVRADPTKLALDVTDAISWNVGPQCGTGTASGIVRAYDTVIDGDGAPTISCAVGHSHRIYCWGDNSWGPVLAPLDFLPYPTPALLPNELADRIGFYGGNTLWTHRDGGPLHIVSRWQGVTTVTIIPFAGPFTVVRRKGESGNQAWCGVTTSGAVKCRGFNFGRWADGATCSSSASDTAFQTLWPVDDVAIGASRGYAVKAGEVWWASGCDSNDIAKPPVKMSLTGVSEVVGGDEGTCARRTDGSVACWSELPPGDVAPTVQAVPVVGATRIHVHRDVGWAALANGTIANWWLPTSVVSLTPGLANPSKLFGYREFAVCGIRTDGALLCREVVNNNAVFSVVPGFEGP